MNNDIYLARISGDSFVFAKNHGLEGEIKISADNFEFNGVISADRVWRTLSEDEAMLNAVENESDVIVRTSYPECGRFAVANAYVCFKCVNGVIDRLKKESRPFEFNRHIGNDAERLVY